MDQKLFSHDDLLALLSEGKHISIKADGVYQRFTSDWIRDTDTIGYKLITTNGMFFRADPVYPKG